MHRATVADLKFADDRNVVLALAGDDARAAAGAHIQIDRHPPLLIGGQRRMRVKGWQRTRFFVIARDLLHELVILAVTIDRRFAHEPTTFDAPVILRDRERICARNFLDRHAVDRLTVSDDVMRIVRCAQKISIESGFFANRPVCLRP